MAGSGVCGLEVMSPLLGSGSDYPVLRAVRRSCGIVPCCRTHVIPALSCPAQSCPVLPSPAPSCPVLPCPDGVPVQRMRVSRLLRQRRTTPSRWRRCLRCCCWRGVVPDARGVVPDACGVGMSVLRGYGREARWQVTADVELCERVHDGKCRGCIGLSTLWNSSSL
ncbi:uncharacterized protein M421DRAFT_220695 [Didymella exigua CBS 183.55]|uniref:Uncharacterized protein n=1 Tax=Didymella exigua CBS 183.55 TaxID=1150837 RepID=A0A6A5RDA9_9PLEO|nr:uncharacterized protein M421DRAFT_220695 [Didymella exigua CBS 183.55]KAF1926245.1 hypothetical protein M421DRAFT_220695 [Didymella exigua CBS 183.55]